jgi:hypothetical protein
LLGDGVPAVRVPEPGLNTSATGRRETCSPLYPGQKAQWFQLIRTRG